MTRDEIFNIIKNHSCEVIPELVSHQFLPHDRLTDLGANSVDRAEIVMMTLEALDLQIPPAELSAVRNIGELAEMLYQRLQKSLF
ncbi:acyl carrier protein [Melghirimyces algeriensis]|uniref:Polyketide biosynthesis acyl carrier protein n=1 Tax=Melghirimyces algeriensis TaxID=910412 RepID=A0A521F5A5_9BACL|nr:acyl carrier protein [Melghirimyces algeriensis]SMO91362.1 polyketide biosynthesis acyl carrier protein [Melghirimyces algeriensis]